MCSLSLCPLLYSSSSYPPLCLVICSGGRSLHRLILSNIVMYRIYRRAHRRIRSRCHWKLKDGYRVEGSNIGIYSGGGGDKGADSLEIPRLTTVEVNRSVKVRRDSRKRSQPILANIGHFLLLLVRVWYNSEYIRKTEFLGISPPHSATHSAATALIIEDK